MERDATIFNPHTRIKVAHEMLVFGLCLCDSLSKQEINNLSLCRERIVDNIKINPTWSTNGIKTLTKNLRLGILGDCFLAVDEALDDAFGKRPDDYSDTDLDSLRAIIYMLRCAIAHGIMIPRWQAKGVFCRKFKINEISYELDATRLDGKIVKHSDYGALGGAITLMEYAEKVVKRHLMQK